MFPMSLFLRKLIDAGPFLQMIFQRIGGDIFFRYHTISDRNAGLMDRLAIAGQEIMPPIEWAALRDETIGTRRRQPCVCLLHDLVHVELDAVRHMLPSVLIVLALAGAVIEQFAGDVRPEDFAGILVLELVQAAAAATIAQGVPFHIGQCIERLCFPEWEGLLVCRHQVLIFRKCARSIDERFYARRISGSCACAVRACKASTAPIRQIMPAVHDTDKFWVESLAPRYAQG